MTILPPPQRPLRLPGARKSDIRTQFAVLAYRVVKDKVQICLVTSRGTGRWIVPKGWPMPGQTPAEAAAMEAWEEAGLKGRVHPQSLGLFSYDKRIDGAALPVIAVVYAMKVKRAHSDWPEAGERRRKWMGLKKAANRLSDPELRHIVQHFDPRTLKV